MHTYCNVPRRRLGVAQTVAKTMDQSGVDPCVAVDEDSPTSVVVDMFAKGLHRVPVLSGDTLVGVISQVCTQFPEYPLPTLAQIELH